MFSLLSAINLLFYFVYIYHQPVFGHLGELAMHEVVEQFHQFDFLHIAFEHDAPIFPKV